MRLGAVLVPASDAEEPRSQLRRSLRLTTRTQTASTRDLPVTVHNLSRTGLLLEAAENALNLGEALLIQLPQAGEVEAYVVWRGERFFGCEFAEAVSRASISAALLQAQPRDQVDTEPKHADLANRPVQLYPELNFTMAVGAALLVWSFVAVAGFLALS